MDARPLAVAAGLLMLVAFALAGAVLLGESSRIPAPRHDLAVIASARPEPPPIISRSPQPDDTGTSPTPAPAPPLAPAPPPSADETAPPADQAPPPVAQEAPVATGHRHRSLRAAPAPVEDRPQAEEPPALEEPPPADTRHPHRTLRAASPPEPDQRQAELTPPSLEPTPPRPPAVDHRYDGVLTVAEIGRLKRSLRLSPDQEPYWPPVAALLREVGRRQMAQVDAGQRPTFDLPGDLSSRLYSAAMPLLGTLREDQKAVVRAHARSLGLGSVASFI